MSRPRSTRTAVCSASSRSRRRTVGFVALHDWLCAFGPIARVGVEGTGAYGAGLSRYLQSCGLVVIEVDRTNRQVRRMQGKSDPVDAIEAARAALSGRASGIAKTADGNVEAIRALLDRATFRPPSPRPLPEPDPSPRFHQPRFTAGTVP